MFLKKKGGRGGGGGGGGTKRKACETLPETAVNAVLTCPTWDVGGVIAMRRAKSHCLNFLWEQGYMKVDP